MISPRTIRACAVVVVITSVWNTAAHADITQWYGFPRDANVYAYDGIDWQLQFLPTVALSKTGVTEGLNCTGLSPGTNDAQVFSMTGAQYVPSQDPSVPDTQGMQLYGTLRADINNNRGWIAATDSLKVSFNFGIVISGGTVKLPSFGATFFLSEFNMQTIVEAASVAGTSNATVHPGQQHTFFFEQSCAFGTTDPLANSIDGGFAINFEWTGYDDDDTLEFFTVNNGIAVQYVPVPAPGAVGLLGISGLVIARRRRA